jgi:glycosyltransferase involved in cell wall biosynthesis
VPPGDVDALLAALTRMIETPAQSFQALKALARTHILENFSIEDVSRRYKELFDELALQPR